MSISSVPEYMYQKSASIGIVFSVQEYKGKRGLDIRYFKLRNLTKRDKAWCVTPKGVRIGLEEVEGFLDVLSQALEELLDIRYERKA